MSRSEDSVDTPWSGSPTGGQAPQNGLRFVREHVPATIEHRSTDLGPYEVHTPDHYRLRAVGHPVATPMEQS